MKVRLAAAGRLQQAEADPIEVVVGLRHQVRGVKKSTKNVKETCPNKSLENPFQRKKQFRFEI